MYIGDFSFLHSSIANSLTFLGEISYSVYLLHPIIFECFKMTINPSSHREKIIVIVLSVLVTPIASYIVYNYFEKYFINLMPAKQKVMTKIPV
ncbi:hypothetical protein Dfri01_19220 [Dyadobacter frigoris]|nr:hypothetical protein Dfri01_19220 [Dyadobacter frigoris]